MQSHREIAADSHVLRTLLGPAIVQGTLEWPRTKKAWGSRYLTVAQILTLASLLQSKEAGDKHGLRSRRMERQTHGPSVKSPMRSHCCVLQELARASALFRGRSSVTEIDVSFFSPSCTRHVLKSLRTARSTILSIIVYNQGLIYHKPPSKPQEHISAP